MDRHAGTVVKLAPLLPLAFFFSASTNALSAELKEKTIQAFNLYVQATEKRIDDELQRPGAFLYLDGLPEPRRDAVVAQLKSGDVYMEQLKTTDVAGKRIAIPDGLIHHWIGAVFIPGTTLSETLRLVQDYDRHKDIFKPEVVDSRLLERNGNHFKIFYRLRKKKVITVTLNTQHDVEYYPADDGHFHSRSRSTRIVEVGDAGNPGEFEKPVGQDGGFLWRLYSYWRFQARDGGVYVECESISLTRDIPMLLSWLIKPFITDIPKESLQMTLGSARSALLGASAALNRH